MTDGWMCESLRPTRGCHVPSLPPPWTACDERLSERGVARTELSSGHRIVCGCCMYVEVEGSCTRLSVHYFLFFVNLSNRSRMLFRCFSFTSAHSPPRPTRLRKWFSNMECTSNIISAASCLSVARYITLHVSVSTVSISHHIPEHDTQSRWNW